MKGFVYLLEIAIAAILMVVVLSTFFAIRVKQSWESSDLIDAGNNILSYIKQDDNYFVDILDGNFSDMIENIKVASIGYGISIKGSPKSNIIVGCAQNYQCAYIQSLLTDVYLNERQITFLVEEFNITAGVPNYYDAIVFVDYNGYTTYKTEIIDFLNTGGMVLGINPVINNNDFYDIFGLSESLNPLPPPGESNHFTAYDPAIEDIEKYFMGIGFDLNRSWYIWEDEWTVDYGTNYINLSRGGEERNLRYEEDTIVLRGPDSIDYSFQVKEIWSGIQKANVQTLSTGFVFEDFSDAIPVEGNKNVVGYFSNSYAEMASNGSAIWISDFPFSSEYVTLLKSAIISRCDEWVAKGVYTERETVTTSSFFSLCCDMPETAELEITLWNIV
ncbi:MAG: hypothetical protein ABIE55_00280 [Candidatus Aenigmatarchaeota archaeon]